MVNDVSPAMWVIAAAVVVAVARAKHVPCYFVFGDSVFDNGNNNGLVTHAKVNYTPYGIDFPNGPTGRFSNGRNIPDFIAEFLGFKDFIPPFTGSSSAQARFGLNYASGGAGIREETGQNLGGRISLGKQIGNHRRAIAKANVARSRLSKCLYTIHIGSNDYINNYFMPPPYTSRLRYTPHHYAYSLVRLYASHLMVLHNLGARKVAVFGVSKIGCVPRVVASHGGGNGCAEEVNAAAALFNERLRALVDDLNKRLVGAKYTFVDMFNGGDASTSGLEVNRSCCTVEPGEELCAANRPVCSDRTKYMFWDAVHGTEAVNAAAAKSAFTGQTASPYSIAALAN